MGGMGGCKQWECWPFTTAVSPYVIPVLAEVICELSLFHVLFFLMPQEFFPGSLVYISSLSKKINTVSLELYAVNMECRGVASMSAISGRAI